MVVSESEALRRAFLDFAETIQSLGPHIARSGGEDEEYEPDPFAQLALETITLWTTRIQKAPPDLGKHLDVGSVLNPLRAAHVFMGKKGGFKVGTDKDKVRKKKKRPVGELDAVVAVGVDALTLLLKLDAQACGVKLESSGAIPALIHAMKTSGSEHLQAASCCCVENMAAVDRGTRGRLVKAGVIPAIVHVLRTTLSQDAAAGACGIVQNLAVDVELLEDIANGDVVPELVGLAHRSHGMEDPTLALAASNAMLNIAAGGEEAILHLGACRASQPLAALLEFQSRANPITGVMDVHAPDLDLCVASASVLSSVACIPSLHDGLFASGCLSTMPKLIHRYMEDGWSGRRGDAIGSMLSVMHNVSNLDSTNKARGLLQASLAGSALAHMVTRIVPQPSGDEADPRSGAASKRRGSMVDEAAELAASLSSKSGGGFASLKSAAGAGVEATLKSATVARKKGAGIGRSRSAQARGGLNESDTDLLERAVACMRNLSAGCLEMCEQMGAAGATQPLAQIVLQKTGEDPPEWCTDQLLIDSLFALANLTEACDANRVHVMQAGIMQRTMLIAGGVEGQHDKAGGPACLLLQSMALNPRVRLRIVERDCVRLMFEILSRESATGIEVAGAAGTVVSLGKTSGQVNKFVQLGGCILASRLCGYQTHPAAIRSVLHLIMVIAEEDEFRKILIHEGAVRAALNLLDESRKVPAQICELACETLAVFAADPNARLHMNKIGVTKVLSEFGDAKQNRWKSARVSIAARTVLNYLGYSA